MIDTIKKLRKKVDQKRGRKLQIKKQIKKTSTRLKRMQKSLEYNLTAQAIIHDTAKKTQQQLEYHINDIVNKALSTVFDDPYELDIKFVSKGGKIAVEMYFIKDGSICDPINVGGGVRDVVSNALRFTAWTLKNPRTRGILFLDEPLHWLKGDDLPEKGATMIKEISKTIGMQILMISHDPELIVAADKVINVKIRKKVSRVQKN